MSTDLIHFFEESAIRPIDSLPMELKRHFLRVASQYINTTHVLVEARRHQRHRLNESALAVRLSDANEPIGPPIQIFVTDVSAGGLGFIHTRAFPAGRIAVRLMGLSGFSVVMIGKIVRCVCRNRAYEIGMEFIERAEKEISPPVEEFDPYAPAVRKEKSEPPFKSSSLFSRRQE